MVLLKSNHHLASRLSMVTTFWRIQLFTLAVRILYCTNIPKSFLKKDPPERMCRPTVEDPILAMIYLYLYIILY